MVDENILVFDIKAQFGFYKSGEVTRATVSYPFSRTAILGLLGAVIGKKRNQIWEPSDTLGDSSIAIEFINPIDHLGLTVNYSHTKHTVNLGSSQISTYLSCQSGDEFSGFVTAVRQDLLRDIHYRVYFRSSDQDLMRDIETRIKENRYVYPPYVGHANLLADLHYINTVKCEEIADDTFEVNSVIPIDAIHQDYFSLMSMKYSIIMGIPIRLKMNKNVIINSELLNFVIPSSGAKLKIKSSGKRDVCRLKIANESKNVVFIN